MGLGEREREFLKSEFRKYYGGNEPDYPYMIERREFGFGFEKKIDFRHKRFSTNSELRSYIISNVPFYISYSVAHYTAPEAKPMKNKAMVDSDLVFDIDVHGCKNHPDEFVCGECLQKAKEDVVRLVEDFLVPDFGVAKKDVGINFSGNRGYHVHVGDERYRGLGVKERREIVNYLNGFGIDAGIFCEAGPTPESPAWFGRVARCISGKLERGDVRNVRKAKKDRYIEGIAKGIWADVRESAWFHREFDGCVREMQANVDEQVTTDVHRLIRLPGSIHGGSALIAKRVADIGRFDPLNECVFIDDGEIEVEVSHAPAMEMKGVVFEEINNKKARLPKYYASYLIAKGAARL